MTRTRLRSPPRDVARPYVPSPAADDPLAQIDCPRLRSAASAVSEAFRNEHGDAIDRDEVGRVAAALAARVAELSSGQEPGGEIEKSLRQSLGRYLLERLRGESVRTWSGDGDVAANEMLQVLNAFERVRAEMEPDWSDHFTSRLTGPGALDLVVEVAHDLRSPLTSILFLAETLQRGQSGLVNDVQRRQLGLIYGAALGLSGVTSDVIELARGGERLVDQDQAPFSIAETLESVRDIVEPIAEEKGLEVKIVIPEGDRRLGHPLALSRVLLNLTTNALKFTDEGWVEIIATPVEHHLTQFAVRDTGRGIPAEALESLYLPFRRTAARGDYCFSGTGLGLAICRKLVEAMGSELEVETQPDWGTRFHFTVALPPAPLL